MKWTRAAGCSLALVTLALATWTAWTPLWIAYHRHRLRDADGDWYSSYRTLVQAGPAGWRAIAGLELDPGPGTRHLLQPIDLGGIDPTTVEGFDAHMSAALQARLESEPWAMAYVQEAHLAYHRAHLEAPAWRDTLLASRDDPRAARLAIANLRVLHERDFDFPWCGPASAQRAAIDRWLAFLELAAR